MRVQDKVLVSKLPGTTIVAIYICKPGSDEGKGLVLSGGSFEGEGLGECNPLSIS